MRPERIGLDFSLSKMIRRSARRGLLAAHYPFPPQCTLAPVNESEAE